MKRIAAHVVVGLVAVLVIALSTSVFAQDSPRRQNTQPAVVTGQTIITVTVVLTDATTITIPITLEVMSQADMPVTLAITATSPQPNNSTYRVDVDSPVFLVRDSETSSTGPMVVTANRSANLRAGPGTEYPVVGNMVAGETLTVVGQTADGSWLLIESGAWVATFLVDGDVTDAPVMEPTATPTPRPTTTPLPTATPLPTPTPDEAAGKAYLAELLPIFQIYLNNLAIVGDKFTDAGYDLSLLFDPDWRIQTAVAITMIQSANSDVRKLNPPAQHAEGHAQLLLAADHYDRAMDLLIEAIDEFDPDKMTLAGTEMTLAADALNRAIEMLMPG